MSLAQRFERRLEGLVGGAFARVFKGQVEPVEIGSGLGELLDDRTAEPGADAGDHRDLAGQDSGVHPSIRSATARWRAAIRSRHSCDVTRPCS